MKFISRMNLSLISVFLLLLFLAPQSFAGVTEDFNGQGLAAYKSKNYEQAKALFSKAIELNSDDTEAKLNLSITLMHLKEYENAVAISYDVLIHAKSFFDKSDAFYNGRKACEFFWSKEVKFKNSFSCASFGDIRKGAFYYYKALLEKPSRAKYELLKKIVIDEFLSEYAEADNHLSEAEIEQLKKGEFPASGNGIVGFVYAQEVLAFVHDSDAKDQNNPPQVAVYNSNGQSFEVIRTQEIYPNSGLYMGSKDFGQLLYHGTYNIAVYVDEKAYNNHQINTYKKMFFAH